MCDAVAYIKYSIDQLSNDGDFGGGDDDVDQFGCEGFVYTNTPIYLWLPPMLLPFVA